MEYTRRIERTFGVGAEPLLHIQNRRGDVRVVGEDRSDLYLEVTLRYKAPNTEAADRAFEAARVPLEQHGDRIEVGPSAFDTGSPFELNVGADLHTTLHGIVEAVRSELGHSGLRVDIAAYVPRSTNVELDQHSGRVTIEGIDGAVRVETASGDTRVRGVGGNVHVGATSGRIEVANVRGDVRVTATSGRVDVRAARGSVEVGNRSGSIRVADASGPLRLSAGAGSITYEGRLVQPASIEAGAGSVRLDVTRNSRFFLDAETRVGSIRSDIRADELRPPPGEDGPVVRVRSSAGSIRIREREAASA